MFDKSVPGEQVRAARPEFPAGSTDDGSVAAIWKRVQVRVRNELGDAVFDSWLGGLQPMESSDDRLVFRTPSPFIRDWVTNHYGACLLRHWNEGTADGAHKQRLYLETHNGAGSMNAAPGATLPNPELPPTAFSGSTDIDRRDNSSPLDERFTFENFVVGKSNEVAYAAARRISEEAQARSSFNPLFLYGGVGLGKTHLMHAIAWEVRRNYSQRSCIYLSAEKFMYQFVRALRFRDTMAFKEEFRKVDILMVDDIQFIAGKESTQEEFFHTFNALIDQNHQIVISADRSPSDLQGIEERIRSRLGGGMVADIHHTDYELRLGILHMKMDEAVHRDNAPKIPPEVLEFLAAHIVSNVREMEGALKRVMAYTNFSHRPASVASAQDILRDLLRANARTVTIDEIQRQVADYYHIRISDLLSARRVRTVVRPRQVAMFLAKELTTRSLPEIGRKFGGRDHTTVLHATRKIVELRNRDSVLDEDLELLRRKLSE